MNDQNHLRMAMIEGNVRGQAKKIHNLLLEIDEIEGMEDVSEIRKKCREILDNEIYWEYQ